MAVTLQITDSSPLWVYSLNNAYFGSAAVANWTQEADDSPSAISSTYHATSGPAAIILPLIWCRSLSSILMSDRSVTAFTPIWDQTSSYTVMPGSGGNQSSIQSGQTFSQAFAASSLELDVTCITETCGTPFAFRGATIVTDIVPAG